MSLWKRIRAVLGADVMSGPTPRHDKEAAKRVDQLEARAQAALRRRAILDAEVDRVEYYLRGKG